MTLRKFEFEHIWLFEKNSSDKDIGQQRKNHSAKEKAKERERKQTHINVFRSRLKVLYLIAMYVWRQLNVSKEETRRKISRKKCKGVLLMEIMVRWECKWMKMNWVEWKVDTLHTGMIGWQLNWQKIPNSCWLFIYFASLVSFWSYFRFIYRFQYNKIWLVITNVKSHFQLSKSEPKSEQSTKRMIEREEIRTNAVIVHGSLRSKWLKKHLFMCVRGLLD